MTEKDQFIIYTYHIKKLNRQPHIRGVFCLWDDGQICIEINEHIIQMNKSSELELEGILKELEGVYLHDSRLEELDNIIDTIPGTLEKLKSMYSEDEKWYG